MRPDDRQLQDYINYLSQEIDAWKKANCGLEERIAEQKRVIVALEQQQRLIEPREYARLIHELEIQGRLIDELKARLYEPIDNCPRAKKSTAASPSTDPLILALLQRIDVLKRKNGKLVGKTFELAPQLRKLREIEEIQTHQKLEELVELEKRQKLKKSQTLLANQVARSTVSTSVLQLSARFDFQAPQPPNSTSLERPPQAPKLTGRVRPNAAHSDRLPMTVDVSKQFAALEDDDVTEHNPLQLSARLFKLVDDGDDDLLDGDMREERTPPIDAKHTAAFSPNKTQDLAPAFEPPKLRLL